MPRRVIVAAVVLAIGSTLWGQDKKPSFRTGRQPARPSLTGKSSNLLVSPARLQRIRTLYIAPMDNHLHLRLAEQFSSWKRFRLVATEKQADAVIKGTCFAARRLKMVKSEIYIREGRSGTPVWQDNVRLAYNPPSLNQVVGQMAVLLVDHLRHTMQTKRR